MNIELAYDILDLLQTIQDAALQMKDYYLKGNMASFDIISGDIYDGLSSIQNFAKREVWEESRICLADACTCGLESLKDINRLVHTHPEKIEWKLEYELASIVETTAIQFYYWGIVDEYPEKREEFQEFLANTDMFKLLKVPETEREYEYDLVITVTGYNKLDYTKQCVESILENLPEGIKCELILFNHGSSDGTKEYFESIQGAKVINIAVNGAMPGVAIKANSVGKYNLYVSNDIIIGKNAIGNLYRCAMEHIDYGYIVPTTSAVSNLQTIPINYGNIKELEQFTLKNNVYNQMKHEQRVRLCNPVTMITTSIWLRMSFDTYEDKLCNKNTFSFPDDKNSVWMRRNGYKCILAKDAYCHHFGSVTLKEDLGTQQKQQEFYLEGRKSFLARYGVDPWGIGSCYSLNLFNKWNFAIKNKATILGINCGLGSNSLKVKEILRENGAEGAILYNATQEGRYLYDLQGISDKAFLFWNLRDMVKNIGIKKYDYIVVEDAIQGNDGNDSLQKILYAGLKFEELAWKMSNGEWQFVKYEDVLK